MITVVILKNPFNHGDREIRQVSYIPGQTVYQYIQPYVMGLKETQVVISHNGGIEEDPQNAVPNPGDYLGACPVIEGGDEGKNPLAVIASLALMEFAPTWAGSLAGAGASAVTVALYQGAIMAVGGLLINHLFPAPRPDQQTNAAAVSPTYRWNSLQATKGQGNVVPITYGKVRTCGQLIGQHVIFEGTKQYLCLLFCGGEGPIDDPDGISDITLNNNPIENYHDVLVEKRFGQNTQTPISFFRESYADQFPNSSLKRGADWVTYRTEGDAGDGVEVVIECPNGLYKINPENGDKESASVTIAVQARRQQADGSWTDWADIREPGANTRKVLRSDRPECFDYMDFTTENYDDSWTITQLVHGGRMTTYEVSSVQSGVIGIAMLNGLFESDGISFRITQNFPEARIYFADETTTTYSDWVISGATTDPIRKIIRGDHITPGRYEVRMKCVAVSGEGANYQTTTAWAMLSHIAYDEFTRPGKVLLGLKVLATDQLSGGEPTISWVQKRSSVYLWNHTTNNYLTFDARNPAVACYDLIHRSRLLDGVYVSFGSPVSQFDPVAWGGWYLFCEQKNLKVDMILDTAGDMWSQLAKLEQVGRGKVIMRGTQFSCIWDGVRDPVQMFAAGNITGGFKQEFLPQKERANAIEIVFTNAAKNYQRDSLTVYGDNYDSSDRLTSPVQISLDGITSYEQAYREAKYRLNLNKYLLQTISFNADIDAISCQLGDVILVQHDVPSWGGIGGRIIAGSCDHLVIDRNDIIPEEGKTYSIIVRLADDTLIQRQISGLAGEHVYVTTPFTVAPAQYDIYVIGEVNRVVKAFTVLSISQSSKLTRKITAIEYIPEVYQEVAVPPQYNQVPVTRRRPRIITGVAVQTDYNNRILISHNPSDELGFVRYGYYLEEVTS